MMPCALGESTLGLLAANCNHAAGTALPTPSELLVEQLGYADGLASLERCMVSSGAANRRPPALRR